MKIYLLKFIITAVTLLTLSHCTSQNSNPSNKEEVNKPTLSIETESSPNEFPIPPMPVMMTNPEEQALFLSKHYWDLYDFADTTLISQPDITEQGLVDYIQILRHVPNADAQSSIDAMMEKAKDQPAMYTHFASLYEKYLYDPNSPFRSDELYIPVVENILKSELISATKREIYSFQKEMLLKNREGTIATDFVYTLANDDKKRMHDLQSNYTILFFTNPDCPSCKATTEQINSSRTLGPVFSINSANSTMLTVLSIYPDSNIDDWRKALPTMPQKNWVNGYDDGTVLTNKRIYDIKAIPTLYLLDKNKKVILKDTYFEEIEEFFMSVR